MMELGWGQGLWSGMTLPVLPKRSKPSLSKNICSSICSADADSIFGLAM